MRVERSRAGIAVAAMVSLGLSVLYVPVLSAYGSRYFLNEDDNHSIVLLVLTGYAFWQDRAAFAWRSTPGEAMCGYAMVVVAIGLCVMGRLTDLVQLIGLSLPLCAAGLCLGFGGQSLLKRWVLPCTLLVFIVPWLGAAVDGILVPLRLFLTKAAAFGVDLLGYPASASGVMVTIGFVQVSIAGACVGLRSMVSMVAIGALFIFFFPMRSFGRAAAFLMLVPAIALLANFLRIVVLMVVAGQFGAVGEAQIHDFAAYGEIMVAMCGFWGLVRLLKVEADQRRLLS